MRPRFVALAPLVLVLWLLPAARAEGQEASLAGYERILSYDSRIVVSSDGSMNVTETIVVEAQHQQINRGIYRDFPTRYWGPLFTRVQVPFEVLSVERNGQPEPYHTEGQSNGVRVYFGSEDVILPTGIHSYRLTYRTDHQLGFFDDHDELYWNVTGNDWAFPVEHATAEVELPRGISPRSVTHEAYTGLQGAQGRDYTSRVDPDGATVHFASTTQLVPGEGLTIVVGFPKGFVPEPSREDRWRAFLDSNRILFAGSIGVLLVFAYYLTSWILVGRDPRRGTIIPLFAPPGAMPPACVRYVRNMSYDSRCFTAAVLDMAIKGALRIEEKKGSYVLERLDQSHDSLSTGERRIAKHLLTARRLELERSSATAEKMKKAIKGLREALRLQYHGVMFRTNRRYVIVGLVLSFLALIASVLVGPPEAIVGFGFMSLWLSLWSFGVYALVANAIGSWRRVLSPGLGLFERTGATFGAVFTSLFAIPFVGGEVVGLGFLAAMTSVWMVPLLLAIVVLNFLFFRLLRQPTSNGRKLMDEIDGFRMYLETAEGDELARMRAPDLTPELFEKYLPYAVALDVENAWSQRFEGVLAEAGRSLDDYRPGWYSGTAWRDLGSAGFASAIGSSMSSAISSASVAPGSSSGGGGGGSSGGGGGGGGGGGW